MKRAFIRHEDAYAHNKFSGDEPVMITPVGVMRSLNLARIDLSPVQYNPVTNTLRIYDQLEVVITFEDGDVAQTMNLKRSKASPYFSSLNRMVANFEPLPPGDELITSAPVTYVIVSDPMFQSTLQPFITWKKKKGFRVIEGYTNDPAVGNTTTSIKAYLQGLYTNPPAGFNAPSFVLFVGDVAQIPAWAGGAGSHVTDLRYCEYTNDNLPEVYYGRFSATTTAQLQPQIDKTLEYEQYLMPDPSFLGEAVMVAGADASYQTHSNGQIYYGTENYFNAAHNILSHTYLQPEPSGANYSQNIQNNVSAGVAYANYTAHCSSSGWADPSFVISDIANLTNAHKYCLMVGNCCLSCKFDVSSFAEEQLRAADKGSVGYIGGSNNTYWDEDYWWGCGFKSVVLHPAYDPAHIGAYDGTFHDHGEPVSEWFITQGQMVVCGNYAVEESNSGLKQYYWEIYHLMGDPSLMIYYSVPPALAATYQTPLMIGMTTLTVNTEPYAYIALSMGGTLLDARLADASGNAVLTFAPLSTPGYADIVITKQNRQPHIGTIQVIPASGPYIVYVSNYVTDPPPGGNSNGLLDYGESDLLSITLKNVGVQQADNVAATLTTTSSHITITDNTETYGNMSPNQVVTVPDGFSCQIAQAVPDQTVIPFTLQATNGTETWNSNFNMTVNAPALAIGAMTIQDTGPGCNNDGILDPGETATLVIVVSNNGHAGVDNVSGVLSIQGGTSPYLVINNASSAIGTLVTGGNGNASFSVTADAATPVGTPVDLALDVTGGASGQYSANASKQVVIGLIPTYIMSGTTISACTGNFYDPGGPDADYSDGQDFTMVINPATTGSMLKIIFSSFALESHSTCGYDYLKIYDGTGTSAPLLGTWCGTGSPGTIIANNATGSLTFVFHSDGSVTEAGWVASLSCLSGIVANPASFVAAAMSNTEIDLTWTPNASGHPVMIACSLTNVFGTPVNGTSYATGETIPGGGSVIFSGMNGTYSHTGLNPSTTYYYKAFSFDATNNYSMGINASANTACGIISTFPWTETFENGGVMPNCWTQEYVTLPGLNWTYVKGNGGSYPSTAHSGNYNACLKDNNSADNKTMLITPVLNISGLPQPQLRFWHTQAYWSGDQDYLTVFYKTTAGGAWTQLASYTGSITTWTQETIALPESTETLYIAFEGNAKYGYGVCIDDVEIASSCATLFPVSVAVEADTNQVPPGTTVTFTATPANGGATPQFQWSVNGMIVSGATSATYSYIPDNQDSITCLLTSSLSCAVGNPAMSAPVVMTIIAVPATIVLQDITITGSECFDATQTITVAGDGRTFTVTDGGFATMIAGQNILLLPGTSVLEGGILWAYIAPSGPFCNEPTKLNTLTGAGNELSVKPSSGYRVYPNPTDGRFMLEVMELGDDFLVEIFSMKGEKMVDQTISGESATEFSLSHLPSGIYLIRISNGHQSESLRLIRL
jgi:uncharacterized cupredoxin-like copper-binding protein